jgi:hypothetical protein
MEVFLSYCSSLFGKISHEFWLDYAINMVLWERFVHFSLCRLYLMAMRGIVLLGMMSSMWFGV